MVGEVFKGAFYRALARIWQLAAARRHLPPPLCCAWPSLSASSLSLAAVSGPLVVATRMSGSFMHELVRVGPKRIVVRCACGAGGR